MRPSPGWEGTRSRRDTKLYGCLRNRPPPAITPAKKTELGNTVFHPERLGRIAVDIIIIIPVRRDNRYAYRNRYGSIDKMISQAHTRRIRPRIEAYELAGRSSRISRAHAQQIIRWISREPPRRLGLQGDYLAVPIARRKGIWSCRNGLARSRNMCNASHSLYPIRAYSPS
jgi:hypothetical protein